jgi:hypothetical protein
MKRSTKINGTALVIFAAGSWQLLVWAVDILKWGFVWLLNL